MEPRRSNAKPHWRVRIGADELRAFCLKFIATENFSGHDRSFDGIVLADASYSEEERRELTELANRVIKGPEYSTANEFEGALPYD